MKPERLIQNSILKYLNSQGVFCWKINNGAVWNAKRNCYQANTTMKGVSDIIGVIPEDGRILAIEIKAPRGVVSEDQKWFLEKIKKDGGISFVARSIDDVQRQLIRIMGGGTHDALD